MEDKSVWTVGSTLAWIQGYLERHGDPNPRLSAQLLIAGACACDRIEIYMNLDKPLAMDERERLREWVVRRGNGEPLQYITGSAPFRYLELKVHPHVLIPRPETEVLVSELLACLPKRARIRSAEYALAEEEAGTVEDVPESEDESDCPEGQDARVAEEVTDDARGEGTGADMLLVADIGCGSGCISCALATEHPAIHVIATDLSPDACALTRENASLQGVSDRIDVIECDLGEGIGDEAIGSFDAVISNPPYIPTELLSALPVEVRAFEPSLALDGGADGLVVFRRIATWAMRALKAGGWLALELHETTLHSARAFAEENGYVDVRIVKDLAGKDRCLLARKG